MIDLKWQVITENESVFNDVRQFSNVSGPVVGGKNG
jgi:hypothetical protein